MPYLTFAYDVHMSPMCTCFFTLQFLRESCILKDDAELVSLLIKHLQDNGQPILFLKSISHWKSRFSVI